MITMPRVPKILILTPVKDAEPVLPHYFKQLKKLNYPRHAISLGFLESDSKDNTYGYIQSRLGELNAYYDSAKLWKKDYNYLIPEGAHRHTEEIQMQRRTILAKSRNQLLFRALEDHDWVLWLDVDVVYYPRSILKTLLRLNKDILHPHCVIEYGGQTYDRNAWRAQGSLFLDDLREEGDMVELDAVGGTMLLIRADVHRDGLIFPPFSYGIQNPKIREHHNWTGEVETEGLGIQCWGLPNLEIKHL
jgi:GT2 family glycosyltransferase